MRIRTSVYLGVGSFCGRIPNHNRRVRPVRRKRAISRYGSNALYEMPAISAQQHILQEMSVQQTFSTRDGSATSNWGFTNHHVSQSTRVHVRVWAVRTWREGSNKAPTNRFSSLKELLESCGDGNN